ncbi:MAG: hypothetical protein GY904_22200 [Planctomycetaceae bacterium]|nr:hypothetical protein [Planctomycetaceae bacterium]
MPEHRQPKKRQPKYSGRDLVREVKAAARGRWSDLLQAAGIPADCLNGRGRPYPKCGGEDRYNAASDVKAVEDLHEVLADFPMFEDADRSAWLAIVLSMIGRSCVGDQPSHSAAFHRLRQALCGTD